MSSHNLSNENINESNVINLDDTVDDRKKKEKKRLAQVNKARKAHHARKNLEKDVRKVYNKAKELDKDREPKQGTYIHVAWNTYHIIFTLNILLFLFILLIVLLILF